MDKNTASPLVSIIIPVYNGSNYMREAIDSALAQTYENIEIILVDDGSPDRSGAMCDAWAEKDGRIKVLHKENGGQATARNKAVEISRGDYIFFVDSDDYIDDDTCQRFADHIGNNVDILVGNAVVEGGSCNLSHIAPGNTVYNGLTYLKISLQNHKSPMAAWLNVYRREFLFNNNLWFKNGILHEDEQFTPRAFLKANSVVVTGIQFYHYVIRSNSITTKKDKRKNGSDLYETCCELEQIFLNIDDETLRNLLLDSLSCKCLNIFQQGRLYRYGKEYIHKDFIKRNAKTKKTKLKAYLFNFSPRLYYLINNISKKL